MFKKISVILLCGLMLVACGAETVTLLDFIGEEEGVSYDGRTLTFYSNEGENGPLLLAYEDNNSIQSDAMKNRIKDIETRLNLNVEFTSTGHSDFSDYYIAAIGSNVNTVDLFFQGVANSLWDLGAAGVLYPMTDFPDYIDLSDFYKYGTPGILEAGMINGVPYAVQPTYWPGYQGVQCFTLVYNADWFGTLNLTPLHEYYENKTWTWDTFLAFCDTAIPLVSVEEDEAVFSANKKYLMNTTFYANGFDFVNVVDGKASLNLYETSAIHAIEFFQKILTYGDAIEFCGGYEDNDSFIEGKTLTKLTTSQSVITGNIAYDSEFTYNIMPFPSGPDAEYGRWAQCVTRIYGLAIPVSTEEPNIVAHVISELCEPFEEFGGNREGLYEYYRNGIFLSDTDVDIFFELEQYVRFDYIDSAISFNYPASISASAETGSATELIQRYAGDAERVFEKFMEPNLSGYLIENMGIE